MICEKKALISILVPSLFVLLEKEERREGEKKKIGEFRLGLRSPSAQTPPGQAISSSWNRTGY